MVATIYDSLAEAPEGISDGNSNVEDRDDVRVGAEAPHCLRLSGDALAGGGVEARGLDQGERHVPVEQRVVCEIDLLLPTLAKEPAHRIASAGEGVGRGRHRGGECRGGLGSRLLRPPCRGSGCRVLRVHRRGGDEREGVGVVGVKGENSPRLLNHHVLGAVGDRSLRLVKQGVDLSLDTFAPHGRRIITHGI